MRNEKLNKRIREALSGVKNIEEKTMFRGVAFMVNGKMCVTAGNNEMMFRFDPKMHNELAERTGVREMMRNGKAIKGYLFVDADSINNKKDFMYWINLALEFNKVAKSSKKKN